MDRIIRIAEEVKREMGSIIQNEIKDPRLPDIVSITAVKITKDLKYAKVYVSVLGDQNNKDNAINALKSAAGFIRRELGRRVRIRNTPELTFILDDSIDRGMHINELIAQTHRDKDRSDS